MESLILVSKLLFLVLSLFYVANAAECNGCLVLDFTSFDKALNKFDVMVVKFDKHNPDQTKHAIFEQVYKDLKDLIGMENMTFAHIDIIDDGMVKNQELVDRYELQSHIFEETLPTISIFIRYQNATNEPENATHYRRQYQDWEQIHYGEEGWKNVTNFNADSLKRSIRELTGIYFTLPGCVDHFDFFAVRFAAEFTNFKKEEIIAEAEEMLLEIPEEESIMRHDANLYIEWMKNAVKSGENTDAFLYEETRKIYIELNNPEGPELVQEKEMRQALNIIDAFKLAARFKMVEAPQHDEL